MLHVVLALALAADKPAQQKIVNPGYFDVSVCALHKPQVGSEVHKEVLMGVLQASRPLVLECLTDARNRTGDGQVVITLEGSVTDTGVATKVSGNGLSPAGQACIQKAIDGWTSGFPQLKKPADAAAVSAQVQFGYMPGIQPSAKMGISDMSDVVANIRLQEPSWCDCFAGATDGAVPAELKGVLKLKKGQATPADVSLAANNDPAGEKIASCLKGKIAAIKIKPTDAEEQDLTLAMEFVNANFSGALPGASGPLQFAQYDINGNQLVAQVFIDDGIRAVHEQHFVDTLNAYNAHKKGLTFAEVVAECKAGEQDDARLVADNDKALEQAKADHDFTAAQKAKDPVWANAEAATAKRLPSMEAQDANVKKIADADKARCDKLAAEEASVPTTKKPAKKKKGKK